METRLSALCLRQCARTDLQPSYRFMKNSKKVTSKNRRRQKGQGQSRAKSQPQVNRGGLDETVGIHRAQPCEPTPPSSIGRKSEPEEVERIRKLWEGKQAELEGRWAIAQSRQTAQNTARRQKLKIAYIVTGAVLSALLCIVAWYFADTSIYGSTIGHFLKQ